MRPTVGRIVHVFDAYTSDGTHAVLAPSPLAAIVTEVPTHIEVEAEDGRLVLAIGVTIFVPLRDMVTMTVPVNVAMYLPAEPGVKLKGDKRGTYWQWPTLSGYVRPQQEG